MRIIANFASSSRSLLPTLTRSLASHAYIPPSTAASSSTLPTGGPSHLNPATSTTPDLTPVQHEVISRIIRVDQAGELGANWIYRGQKWAMGLRNDTATQQEIEVSSLTIYSNPQPGYYT